MVGVAHSPDDSALTVLLYQECKRTNLHNQLQASTLEEKQLKASARCLPRVAVTFPLQLALQQPDITHLPRSGAHSLAAAVMRQQGDAM
jgi:hypothetical protein